MKLNLIIVILAVGLLLAGGVFILSKRSTGLPTPTMTGTTNDTNTQSAVSTKPQDTTLTVSKTDASSYDLSVSSTSPKTLTGVSVRLTFPNTGVDFSAGTFTPNPELVANGWIFPVKTVELDSQNNVVNVDIAGINPSTEGYSLTSEVSLGTLSNFPDLTFTADKSQTKIIEKNGEELNYIFNQR